MATAPTNNFDFQNFYSGQLTADITSGALTVNLDTVPTPTEGILVIDPDSTTNREIIFYTGKTGTTVTLPSDGRGWDSSTATAHTNGTTVIMAPVAYMLRMLKTGSLFDSSRTGWTTLGYTFGTVVANGNRSYTATVAGQDVTSIISPGMRLKMARTVAAPTQCTSLNGTTQYYSKTSPAGMTFTNNFVVSGWIKLSSYALGSIASRYNGTSGWDLQVASTGQIQLIGYNAGVANSSQITSYQSIPLNKWTHVALQLDMSTFTSTTTTSYCMIDGVDVPASSTRNGTNPTALIQAGNLEIGSRNGGLQPFPGKLAQVAIYNAKVTQATILASMHQTLAGTETSLISAYSFNGVITDLSANANTLTANGSAVATTNDTPFTQTQNLTSITTGTTNYGIVQSATFSTNTTVVIQVPEGDTIPTSGGVTTVYYGSNKVPYGFPGSISKWRIETLIGSNLTVSMAATSTWYAYTASLTIPIGDFKYGWQGTAQQACSTPSTIDAYTSMGSSSPPDPDLQIRSQSSVAAAYIDYGSYRDKSASLTVATVFSMYQYAGAAAGTISGLLLGTGSTGQGPLFKMFAEVANL